VTIGAGLTIFLCGDVMTGRGIDQLFPHHVDPTLREPAVTDARTYVRLAEQANGAVPKPADFAWPWGEALAIIDEFAPDFRLFNLETSITEGGHFAPGKSVHYRMHPKNVACPTAVHPDLCVLANNHVLDFGPEGLADTLRALRGAETRYAGAGLDVDEAERPVVCPLARGGRVITVGAGMASSGIPRGWAATENRPGVAFVGDLSLRSATRLAERACGLKRPGDIVVASLHWGSNWGYEIDSSQIQFAHTLIDAGVDVVHGHSSHHPRPIEVYRGKLILYGCGDTVNDYEGIGGYDIYRDELRLLYLASIDPDSGRLDTLRMTPMRARRLRLDRASRDDAAWLHDTIQKISRPFGTRIDGEADGTLTVTGAH
jgi:poly-gamma-glutamate synthesis protein (capsule biosynthesis protein)